MAKQWTRNYDNLFCSAFGCYEVPNSGTADPSFDAPMVRRPNGLYYPTVQLNYENRIFHAYGITVPEPKTYLNSVNNGLYPNTTTNINLTSAISLGTGITPPTYEDYKLENPLTSGFTLGVVNATQTYDEDTHIYTRTFKIPLAYSGVNDVVVSEFGIFIHAMTEAYNYGNPVLVYRETLDNPVTLSTNDTIEITFSQSIMQPNYTPYPVVE